MTKLYVIDYHLRGPVVRVPSREADTFHLHLHGWLYRIAHEERRPTEPDRHIAPFGAWLLSPNRRSARPGVVSVRVCWYGEQYLQQSIANLASNPTAIIGSVPYVLDGMTPVTREALSRGDILEMGGNDPSTKASLVTITPVGFRVGGCAHCTLDPETVIGSAMHRWERIWPGTLPGGLSTDPRERAWLGRIAVSRLEVRTHFRRIEDKVQGGVTGEADYVLGDLSQERRALAITLLRFSEVAGLGSRTAYGFGGVRVETEVGAGILAKAA